MKLGVFGAGYVGLVTGTCFAEMGNEVTCCDVDADRIEKLRTGESPIYEPGLEELILRNIEEGRLRFTTDAREAVSGSEVVFIAVGTPSDEDGSADLTRVLEVAATIGRNAESPKIVVNKSTVPVGTGDLVQAELERVAEHRCVVVSNPEFLREGNAVEDFMRPDRIVVGLNDSVGRQVLAALYAPFVRTGNPILFMDLRSAEMTKYAANAMLAARITFMNEIANLCERVGADVDRVRAGIGTDRRIGTSYLFPGIGFGGSCFPKDIRALKRLAEEVEYDFPMIHAVEKVNSGQRRLLAEKIREHYGEEPVGRHFAFWGLSFKPRTDDVREAPALELIEELLRAGASITVFDPEAMDNARRQLGDRVEYASDAYSALRDKDALVVATEWNEFRFPDFERIKMELGEAVVFDGRNIYDPDKMASVGFVYYSIGRADRVETAGGARSRPSGSVDAE